MSVLGCGRKVVREAIRSKRKTTRGLRGAVWCCRGMATVVRRRRNAGVRASATRVSYSLTDLAQQKEGGNAVLTEGSGRRMRDAGSAVTLIGGVVRAELADRAVWWSSWLLDPAVRLVGLLQS